jgi:protein SPT2
MFRRPDRGPVREYDDDSGSDMEAGLSDVEMEEKRALKIARREDEEAEREENARREAKEKMKRARK